MTLDPVHFKAISRLASGVSRSVDESQHREFGETVWEEWLDPLVSDGREVVEPLGEQRRYRVDATDIALEADEYHPRHGLDSGTINPTTFNNGLVADVAHAAMSRVPSDLELHRGRTNVVAVHSNDVTMGNVGGDWQMDDGGYVRQRLLHVPTTDHAKTAVVHELALYMAEATHATENADAVTDLLVMDGPIYPKGLLTWLQRDPELAELLASDERPREVLQLYIDLVERFIERDIPMLGFVKNPASRLITRAIREKEGNSPWLNDAAFFSQLLEQGEMDDGEWVRETEELTYTNWFVSRGSTDRALVSPDVPGVEHAYDNEAYEVTFTMVYDPRTDTVYRVEAPRYFTDDADRRDRLIRQILKGVASEQGPPAVVGKADSLAKISARETTALRRALEEAFDSEIDADYNDDRWGPFVE